MQLPARLRLHFQEAYKNKLGEKLDADSADALGLWFVNFLGTVATIRARHVRSSRRDAALDVHAHGRDSVGNDS